MTKPKKSKRKMKSDAPKETPVGAVIYRGPISGLPWKQSLDLHTCLLALDVVSSTSVGGAIGAVFGSSPGTSSDWTAAAGLFREYRTLGIEVTYVPNTKYSTVSQGVMYSVVDYQSSTALASYAAASANSSVGIHDTSGRFTVLARMHNVNDAQWSPTASPLSLYWIKLYADTLAAATNYGRYLVRYLVQFRGV
jgi:hypothetical protein